MSLPATRCIICTAPQPANAHAWLTGIAVRDDTTQAWSVRALTEYGVGDREWITDDPAPLTEGDTLVEDGDAVLIVDQRMSDDDWPTVCDEVAKDIADARERLAMAMRAAEIVGRCAVDAGFSESDTARRIGVDRMTVRKWLGKL